MWKITSNTQSSVCTLIPKREPSYSMYIHHIHKVFKVWSYCTKCIVNMCTYLLLYRLSDYCKSEYTNFFSYLYNIFLSTCNVNFSLNPTPCKFLIKELHRGRGGGTWSTDYWQMSSALPTKLHKLSWYNEGQAIPSTHTQQLINHKVWMYNCLCTSLYLLTS